MLNVEKVYIIAEAGVNHNGKIKLAYNSRTNNVISPKIKGKFLFLDHILKNNYNIYQLRE